ncbi:MAG TPA: hypothetical protein VF175_12620 [Lacipirellula sp.]
MKRLIFAFVLMLAPAERCLAISTQFEDLVAATQYAVGSSFTSGGIRFDVLSYPYSFPLRVGTNNYAGGSGHELWMGSGVGVQIAIPPATSQVSFKFGQYHSDNGLRINGVESPWRTNIRQLDGTTLGGVAVTVEDTSQIRPIGTVTLTGAISSLFVGGVEFAIDDLDITAPAASPDFDADGDVDGADFLRWQRGLGTSSAAAANGDADGDRDVDGADLVVWRNGLGATIAEAAVSIPEPSALILAVVSFAALSHHRRARARNILVP